MKRIEYEDDIVVVTDQDGNEVYKGEFDYCPYKYDDYHWNERECCYDLPHGYKIGAL